jgi:hypothetical protein
MGTNEDNQVKWMGIRPVSGMNPIPVEEQSPLTSIEIEPKTGADPIPVEEQSPITEIEVVPKNGEVFECRVRPRVETSGWATQGLIHNPSSGDVLADTGQLGTGVYDFDVYVTCNTANTWLILQHRNAANDDNVAQTYMILGQYSNVIVPLHNYVMVAYQRIRVIASATAPEYMQVNITYRRFTISGVPGGG